MAGYTKKELTDYLLKLAIMDEELKLGKAIDKIVFTVFIATLWQDIEKNIYLYYNNFRLKIILLIKEENERDYFRPSNG